MLKLLLCSVLVLAISLQLVSGWFATGHMLTAQIAWKYLNQPGAASPETLKALENALTSLLTYTDDSNTIVTAAVWMDDLKSRGLNQYDAWHFINLPICDWEGNITDSCNGTSVYDVLNNEDEQQVIWAIGQALATLRSKDALGYERGFALRNLLHLVGDLHQPLHVGNRFSAETPNGDEGGNKFRINDTLWSNDLHFLWDSGVGMLNNSINRPLSDTDAQYLSNMADSIMNYTAALIQLKGNGTDVTEWAMESYALAVTYSYNISWWATPSPDYIATSWGVVQNQLGLGGYRLSLLLKQIYPCGANKNCPEAESQIIKEEKNFKIGLIIVGVALGLSVVLNIGQFARSKRSKYEPVH